MIIFLLGIIFGIAGIIPPQHFSGWEWAALIEMLVELPAALIVLYIKGTIEEKKQAQKIKAYKARARARAREKANADKYAAGMKKAENRQFTDVSSGIDIEAKNPYAKDTLRYHAFEERRREKYHD